MSYGFWFMTLFYRLNRTSYPSVQRNPTDSRRGELCSPANVRLNLNENGGSKPPPYNVTECYSFPYVISVTVPPYEICKVSSAYGDNVKF